MQQPVSHPSIDHLSCTLTGQRRPVVLMLHRESSIYHFPENRTNLRVLGDFPYLRRRMSRTTTRVVTSDVHHYRKGIVQTPPQAEVAQRIPRPVEPAFRCHQGRLSFDGRGIARPTLGHELPRRHDPQQPHGQRLDTLSLTHAALRLRYGSLRDGDTSPRRRVQVDGRADSVQGK